MKKNFYIFTGILIAIVVFGCLCGLRLLTASAEKATGQQWEYCAITNIYIANDTANQAVISGGANICYLQISGCQNEEIRADLIYTKFLQDFRLENDSNGKSLALTRAKDLAYSKAVAKLGIDGWEMTSLPGIKLDAYQLNIQGTYTITQGTKDTKTDIYFKRIRQ